MPYVFGHIEYEKGCANTRNLLDKKRFIRNENLTSPIFAIFKEQTSPFFSND